MSERITNLNLNIHSDDIADPEVFWKMADALGQALITAGLRAPPPPRLTPAPRRAAVLLRLPLGALPVRACDALSTAFQSYGGAGEVALDALTEYARDEEGCLP